MLLTVTLVVFHETIYESIHLDRHASKLKRHGQNNGSGYFIGSIELIAGLLDAQIEAFFIHSLDM